MSASVLHIPQDERVRQSMLREMLSRNGGELNKHTIAEPRLDLPLIPPDSGTSRIRRLPSSVNQSLRGFAEVSD